MYCFNHEEKSASGICAFCGKAICKDCINFSKFQQLACSPTCASKSSNLSETIEQISSKTNSGCIVAAWYCLGFGAVFIVPGIILLIKGQFVGLLFIAFSLASILASFGYFRVAKNKRSC